MIHYPIVIHKDGASDYGVSVPDLPGCVTAGRSMDEALAMAREAIELHLEGMIEDAGVPPLPTPIETLQADPDWTGGVWAIVGVDEAELSIRVARLGITLPERLIRAVDRRAKAEGSHRSTLIARALVAYIGADPGAIPKPRQGGGKLRGIKKKAGTRK